MTERISALNPLFDEIQELVLAAQNGGLSPGQAERLECLVCENATARRLYAKYVLETASLRVWAASESDGCEEQILGCEQDDLDFSVQAAVPTVVVPTVSRTMSGASLNNWLVSYFAASVILCIALLGGWAYKITHYDNNIVSHQNQPGIEKSQPEFVGRITDMADCRWADPDTRPYAGSYIPLGRKYELTSGLLEITYTTGARVILEGPCSYTVDSEAGGRLQLGKLVARVEKNDELGIMNDESRVSDSDIHHSSFITHNLFSVTTPTAVVTDLGTEFGVEVNGNGDTISHVFRGTVRVQVVGEGRQEGVLLHADESARVARKSSSEETALYRLGKNDTAPKFVRRMAPLPTTLDLLDIVAGGDGTGHRRERGIDPATGKEAPFFLIRQYLGSDQYKNVDWHLLIDGVFVPQRNTTVIQLDSAGHTFDGFGHGTGGTFCTLWARAADVSSINQNMAPRYFWVYSMGPAKQFQPNGGGLLCIRSCTGITFDLAAMRKMFPGGRPARFRATAGMGDAALKYEEPYGMADLWIFIDGRLKYNRKQLQVKDGPIEIDLDIGPEDRFFTLVTTDSRNGCKFDWVVYGEPVFEMASTDSDTQISPIKQSQPGE